jgi:spore coat protein U-like protein
MKKLSRLVLAVCLAASASLAQAATTTGSFQVTATVPATCTFNTGTTLGFGTIDPTVVTNAQSTISFHCTKNTPWNVWLDAGLNNGNASGTTRAMKSLSQTDYLSYELYTAATYDAAHVWANSGTSGTNVVSGNGSGTGGNAVTVYGHIAAGLYPTPASDYTDTITVTINY